LEITGGNAEGAENKGLAEKATRKLMEGRELKIEVERKRVFADRRVGITSGNCGWCGSETT
jgi:hypothetical protein